jgi:hypothetical protein
VVGDEYVDASLEDMSGAPGLGLDSTRPLGDTPDAHDEIVPEDLPKSHPGRHAAERQAAEGEGVTRGHAEGGAAGAQGDAERRGAERLGPREKGRARTKP